MLCAKGRLGLVCVGTPGPHKPAGPGDLPGLGCLENFWKCQDQECPHPIFGIWKLGKIIHFHGDTAGRQGAGLKVATPCLGKETVLVQEALSILQPSF